MNAIPVFEGPHLAMCVAPPNFARIVVAPAGENKAATALHLLGLWLDKPRAIA